MLKKQPNLALNRAVILHYYINNNVAVQSPYVPVRPDNYNTHIHWERPGRNPRLTSD